MLRHLAVALVLAAPFPAIAQDDQGHLTMAGTAQVMAEPDIIRATAGILVEETSAAAALGTAKQRMATLRAKMTPFGTVSASQILLAQDQSRGKSLMGSGDPGYSARGTVTVTLSDPEQAGAALDMFLATGIDGIARLDHDIADRAALMTEARENATADAILRAQTYARAADITLGPIVEVSERSADTGGSMGHRGPASKAYGGAQGMAGLPMSGATATVTIRWAIEE